MYYDHQFLFYEEWTNEASELLITLDKELFSVLAKLPVAPDFLMPILPYYESTDAEEVEQSKAMIASLLKEKAAPQFEKKGGIKNVEALSETIAEDGKSAVVELKITYGDGSEETEKAEMKLDGDEWKLAMDK